MDTKRVGSSGVVQGIFALVLVVQSWVLASNVNHAAAAVDSGPGGGSVTLDGSSNFIVQHAANFNNTTAMTWEAWVKPANTIGCQTLMGKNYTVNWWLGLCGGALRMYSGGGTAPQDAPTPLSVAAWHHVAVTWTSGAQRIYYIDGTPVYTGSADTGSAGLADIGLGADFDNNYRFTGSLAELRIWQTARTASQIGEYANVALSGHEAGLAGYWPLAGDADNKVNGKTAAAVGSPSLKGPMLPWAGTCGGIYEATLYATLYEAAPNTAHGSDLFLDLSNASGAGRKTVLGFAPVLSTNMTIYRAMLELTLGGQTPPPDYTVKVQSYPHGFTETTQTWNNSGAGTEPDSRRDFHNQYTGAIQLDVTTQVIDWLNMDASKWNLLVYNPDAAPISVQSRENQARPRLIIDCAVAQPAIPDDSPAKDAAQLASLNKLKLNSTTPVEIRFGEDGTVRSASFTLAVPPTVHGNNADRARWFMTEYKELLRVANPDAEFQLVDNSQDGKHLRYRSHINGIPILGSEIIVHAGDTNGVLIGLNARYAGLRTLALPAANAVHRVDMTDIAAPNLDPLGVRIPQAAAEAIARASNWPHPVIGPGMNKSETVVGNSSLEYVLPALLGMADTGLHLTHKITLRGTSNETAFIDAQTGQHLLSLPHEYDSYDMEMRSARGQRSDPVFCWLFTGNSDWFDESGARPGAFTDAEGRAAFANSQAIDAYWRGTWHQDSWNNSGEKQNFVLHEGGNLGTPTYFNNAYFSTWCNNLSFGQGNATRDIMGHEWTHAVVDRNGGLIYENEPGALNESVADIFGWMVDQGNVTMGEGSSIGTIRNFQNPPANGNPDHVLATHSGTGSGLVTSPAPDCATNDCGGVHSNSGIHNKVASLLVFGGTHDGRVIVQVGPNKVAQLYRNILLHRRLPSSAHFIDMRDAALAEARALTGIASTGWSARDACQVQNAYAAVGLGGGDVDCDGILDVLDSDIDGDGVPNARDNCPTTFNPGQSDIDGDGIGDSCDPDIDGDGLANAVDNCRLVRNPGQEDFNVNGRGDVCDDSDSDHVLDSVDNCRTTPNTDQRDMDHDGIGDVCDADRDGDGVPNTRDNAPDVYNPDQRDGDHDGIGDVIDLCPAVASSDNSDIDHDGLAAPCDPDDDGDGVLDTVDNCPNVYNPDQTDRDGNGVGLACDPAELRALVNPGGVYNTNFAGARSLIPIPVPECLPCGTDGLRVNYGVDVGVTLPAGMGARVIDNTGAAVGVTQMANGALRFFPPANASSGILIGLLARGDALGLGAPSDAVSYRLELYTLNGAAPAAPVTVPVTMRAGNFTTVFLPVVGR